jgi:adenine-specific DNA-methyltransferase
VPAIDDLISQIADRTLRERLQREAVRLGQERKFGLVFEEHIPECTPLYNMPIKKGSTVSLKGRNISDRHIVDKIANGRATCVSDSTGEKAEFPLGVIVPVAQFGEPIFPHLLSMGEVENAPGSQLWHTLIEADNYHALQLLEYLYPKQVDCIYIDPPYNTGAKDWKYNNDYVGQDDAWRHSKWLSMMKKRLLMAKRILNPDSGVLIVTIDEHEVHHLRTLLGEIFSDAYIQMVTTVTNPKGITQGRFSRVEEYLIYCFMKNAYVHESNDNLLNIPKNGRKPRWKGLLRSGTNSLRSDRKNMFYPILIDNNRKCIIRAERSVPYSENVDVTAKIDGYDVAYPIRNDGSEGNWGVGFLTLNELIAKGYVALGSFDAKRKTWGITYISEPNQQKIERGEIEIVNRDPITGVVEIDYVNENTRVIKTVWHRTLHDAGVYGSNLVSSIVGQSRAFSFPKSLYSTKDAIAAVVRNNPNALIVDFFAGSGTTLHAVNLLNAEDGGKRRCILVTNNEVSNSEAKELKTRGHQSGDREWEMRGICESVTWPRTKYSIRGKRDDGSALSGEYFTALTKGKGISRNFSQIAFTTFPQLGAAAKKKQLVSLLGKDKLAQSLAGEDNRFIVSENHPASILFDDTAAEEWLDALDGQDHIREFYMVTQNKALFNGTKEKIQELLGDYIVHELVKLPMGDGFKANAEYFKLGFLDKHSVVLGKQFSEIIPMLWLKSGAKGKRPAVGGQSVPHMFLPLGSNFAVLANEAHFPKFLGEIEKRPDIEHVFIVTDSETAFREMAKSVCGASATQLYRNYLDNFVINSRRAEDEARSIPFSEKRPSGSGEVHKERQCRATVGLERVGHNFFFGAHGIWQYDSNRRRRPRAFLPFGHGKA